VCDGRCERGSGVEGEDERRECPERACGRLSGV
jgi:hypothetical protein